MKKLILSFMAMCCAFALTAQVTGTIVDGSDGTPLIGATVMFSGSTSGTLTDVDGNFTLNGSGDAIEISYLGYASKTISIGGLSNLGLLRMNQTGVGLDEVVISGVVDIIQDRSTPVAVSTISAREIQLKLGNQEFPEIMKSTPSIYVTKQGGGYGDARINVRGFDQRNTSYMINGQPVNDMENGWVYWSNWAGLQDIASAIQIQRGIGASRLAVPSVGGTVSIVTKSTDREAGGFVSVGAGNDGYIKTTASYGTGTMSNGFSASVLMSRWQGNGYVDGTEGQGYNYLAALGYDAGGGHKFNASFLGAGQWHHQRDLDLTIRDFENYGGDDFRKFNADWGMLDGEEFSFRRNFYHKPLASINWDWEVSSKTTVAAVAYGSWGRGGGTGPRGRNFGIYPFRKDLTQGIEDGLDYRLADGTIDFPGIIANNQSGDVYTGSDAAGSGLILGANDGDLGGVDGINNNIAIRRASINSHDWYGGILNISHKVSDNFNVGLGFDGRSYSGIHYRNLNNLLGLGGYVSNSDSNNPSNIITETNDANAFVSIGDEEKLNYYNIGNVNWLGANGLAEYDNKTFAAVIQAGVSNQSYQREDFFRYSGAEQQSDSHSIVGGFVKGGVNYNINANHNIFANSGVIRRQPNFDAVFPNFANDVNADVENEEIFSLELGYGIDYSKFRANINLYSTSWGNRFLSRGVDLGGGIEGTATFANLKNLHRGLEIESDFALTSKLDISAMVSLGNWTYNGNVDAAVFDDNQNEIGTSTLYLEDVKVGDAAQTTMSIGADYEIVKGLKVDATFLYFDNLFADFRVIDDSFLEQNNEGAVKLPSYNLVDLGATYNLILNNNDVITFRANINNLFDTEYISESNTNFHVDGAEDTYNGISKRNYVWWGFGRTWNVSLKYSF